MSTCHPGALGDVGRYLDRHSLTMCLRAYHQWHQVLRHQIWEVVEKRTGESSGFDLGISNGPSWPLVRMNADHIRKLVLRVLRSDIGFSGELAFYCPRLTELTVETSRHRPHCYISSSLKEYLSSFIVQHQGSLKKLVLHVGQSEELVDAMAACSHLESLTTTGVPHLLETQELCDWMDWY